MEPLVSIIMGSTSDWPIMENAAKLLDEFEIPFEVNALSAHRTPKMVEEFATNAHKRGVKVIIAGAGGAAHLPGVIAAFTPLPVIGVPCRSSISIDGWDSILSILQMPPGSSRCYCWSRCCSKRCYSRYSNSFPYQTKIFKKIH